MTRRQKWTQQEDDDLRAMIMENVDDPKWDLIAVRMEAKTYNKNAKQCRER